MRIAFLSLLRSCAVFFVSGILAGSVLGEGAPRVFSEGELPNDARLADPITLHDYHPFRPVASAAEWEERQRAIQRRIAVASGLWPLPTKTPLRPRIHRKIDCGDYSVEAVIFESFPGHFVTGSLYRPLGDSLSVGEKEGKRPGVLCPHGHWKEGRFYDAGEAQALNHLANGAERFVAAAHNPIQARCVQLARMGCVVLLYDMIGYADSIQFAEHRRGPRESMSSSERGEWGFVSPQAMARLQTNFGLQTWNSVRALDFLLELEGIDPERILVTGASGGGTQTQILSAIDDRVTAAFPCVMPSTAMQGGCTCENALLLRIGQGNIDMAAAVAPRPLGITAADDWTIELETKGHPDLLEVYKMVSAPKNYEAHFDIHFKHNYNHVSRTHLYQFVNRHFRLGLKSPVLERDYERREKDELTVWAGDHSAPTGDQVGDAHEREVNRRWAEDSDAKINALLSPETAADLQRAREVIGGGIEVLLGRDLPEAKDVNFGLIGKEERTGYLEMTGLIGNDAHGEEIPAAFLFPGKDTWNQRVAIWLSPKGKSGLFEGDHLSEPVRQLVERGFAVVGLDLFGQGEFLNAGEAAAKNPQITYSKNGKDLAADSWQRSSVYFYGYNHSLFAKRVHDVLTAITFAWNHDTWTPEEVSLIGEPGTGHWVAAARHAAGDQVDRAVVNTGGFRFANLESDWDADFLPGAVKYGDLAGLLLGSAPESLMVIDDDADLAEKMEAIYAAAEAPEGALRFGGDHTAVIEYLAE